MKKLSKFIIIVSLFITLLGCQKENIEPFDTTLTYEKDGIQLQLRNINISETVDPTNRNDQYYYWDHINDNYLIYDMAFYVQNNSEDTISLNDILKFSYPTDENIEHELCLEINHYTEIDLNTTLEPHSKSIAHAMFYFPKDTLNTLIAEGSENILITLFDQTYTLTMQEKSIEVETLEREDTITFGNVDVTIVSASTSPVIPPLNMTEDSTYYTSEDPNLQYAGMYALIENKSNEPFNVLEQIATYIDIAGENLTPGWISLLSEDDSQFIEDYVIPANSKRHVLFFQEVPLDYSDTDYSVYLVYQGKPYKHTYTHLVVSR